MQIGVRKGISSSVLPRTRNVGWGDAFARIVLVRASVELEVQFGGFGESGPVQHDLTRLVRGRKRGQLRLDRFLHRCDARERIPHYDGRKIEVRQGHIGCVGQWIAGHIRRIQNFLVPDAGRIRLVHVPDPAGAARPDELGHLTVRALIRASQAIRVEALVCIEQRAVRILEPKKIGDIPVVHIRVNAVGGVPHQLGRSLIDPRFVVHPRIREDRLAQGHQTVVRVFHLIVGLLVVVQQPHVFLTRFARPLRPIYHPPDIVHRIPIEPRHEIGERQAARCDKVRAIEAKVQRKVRIGVVVGIPDAPVNLVFLEQQRDRRIHGAVIHLPNIGAPVVLPDFQRHALGQHNVADGVFEGLALLVGVIRHILLYGLPDVGGFLIQSLRIVVAIVLGPRDLLVRAHMDGDEVDLGDISDFLIIPRDLDSIGDAVFVLVLHVVRVVHHQHVFSGGNARMRRRLGGLGCSLLGHGVFVVDQGRCGSGQRKHN